MNDLEDRLSAALSARAEQVQAEDLTPATPPETVTFLRRRTRPALYALAAAAAVAVVATAVVTSGTDTAEPGPAAPSTVVDSSAPAPGQTPTTPPVDRDLTALLDEDDPLFVGAGTEVRFMNGRGSIQGDELVVTEQGTTRRTTIVDTYGAIGLARFQIQLGQAGTGYLVDLGDGETSAFALYVANNDGGFTVATVTGGVPFGTGFTADEGDGYFTYTTGDGSGLYTRLSVGDPSQDRYRVYRWEVPGPGEGGQAPDNLEVELVPSEVGVFCLDFGKQLYKRCL